MPEIAAVLRRCSFPPPGTAVTCGVSGGPDSLALLVLATSAGCDVTAVHVDHGLRPGSQTEADVVAAAAMRFGARFRAEQVQVRPGPNLEARLRAARYGALPPDVLTGHTADDQAETVLLNLIRGCAVSGLAGMRDDRRPLIALRRSETWSLCRDFGLDPVLDPTNDSPVHRRNRIRHEVLPLLDDVAARDVAGVISRSTPIIRDEDEFMEVLARSLDPADARGLSSAPVALARRAVRRWLTPHLGGYPPDHDTVERVLQVARGDTEACETTGGLRVVRSHQRLRVE